MKSLSNAVRSFIGVSIFCGILLSGCGTTSATNGTASSNQAATNTSASSSSATSTVNVKDGTTKLLAIATQLKSEIAGGDEAKIKADGPKLEDSWSSFEDRVKPDYPDLYAKVEQYLDPTVAGSKANPIDKQTLQKLDDSLIQTLTELSAKAK